MCYTHIAHTNTLHADQATNLRVEEDAAAVTRVLPSLLAHIQPHRSAQLRLPSPREQSNHLGEARRRQDVGQHAKHRVADRGARQQHRLVHFAHAWLVYMVCVVRIFVLVLTEHMHAHARIPL